MMMMMIVDNIASNFATGGEVGQTGARVRAESASVAVRTQGRAARVFERSELLPFLKFFVRSTHFAFD